jgi:hypothetical protein
MLFITTQSPNVAAIRTDGMTVTILTVSNTQALLSFTVPGQTANRTISLFNLNILMMSNTLT